MRIFFVFIFVSLFIVVSCRKPTDDCEEFMNNGSHQGSCDLTFTDPNYDYIKINYEVFFPLPPSIIFDNYLFYDPVYNPNNDCEVAYIKADKINPQEYQEVWKFDMETGDSEMISDNYLYNLDWGSNGWLLYTGTGNQVYKVKSNGDSLTQLTNSVGYNNTGRWNPSSSLYWYFNLGHRYVYPNGEVAFTFTGNSLDKNYDWINDSTVYGLDNGKLYSLSFPSGILTLLFDPEPHNAELFIYGKYILDRENMNCYTDICIDDSLCYYAKLDLSGSNSLDTLTKWYSSYNYFDFYNLSRGGDFSNGKVLTTLSRNERPDITVNEIYRRSNILIMNDDGSDERLLLLLD